MERNSSIFNILIIIFAQKYTTSNHVYNMSSTFTKFSKNITTDFLMKNQNFQAILEINKYKKEKRDFLCDKRLCETRFLFTRLH